VGVYLFVWFCVATTGYKILYDHFGTTREWAMLIFLAPLAVTGYFINKKKDRERRSSAWEEPMAMTNILNRRRNQP